MSNSKRLEAIKTRLNKIPKLTTPISHATFQVQDVRDLLAVVEMVEQWAIRNGECLNCDAFWHEHDFHEPGCPMQEFDDKPEKEEE